MKKILFVALSSLLLFIFTIPTYAISENKTTLTTTVPETHIIAINCSTGGSSIIDGVKYSGNSKYEIKRLNDFLMALIPDKGYTLKSVLLNEVDITNSITDGTFKIPSVNKNCSIKILFNKSSMEDKQKGIVGVTIKNETKRAIDVTILIKSGNNIIESKDEKNLMEGTTTFYFNSLEENRYNVVVTCDQFTQTKMVNVKDYEIQALSFFIQNQRNNTIVEVKGNAPDIVVNNMTDIFSNPTNDTTKGITQEELNSGNDIEIRIIAEELRLDEQTIQVEKDLINNMADKKEIGLFIDLSVYKTIISADGQSSSVKLSEVPSLLSVSIPISDNIKNKTDLLVYRAHNGNIDIITTKPNANGEYFEVDGNYIILYIRLFSTYAIGYSNLDNTPTTGDKGISLWWVSLVSSIILLTYTITFMKRHKLNKSKYKMA